MGVGVFEGTVDNPMHTMVTLNHTVPGKHYFLQSRVQN